MIDSQANVKLTKLNDTIIVDIAILKLTVACVAEAELRGLFLNRQMITELCSMLWDMRLPLPLREIICGNTMADCTAISSIEYQCSFFMNVHYFWVINQVEKEPFCI